MERSPSFYWMIIIVILVVALVSSIAEQVDLDDEVKVLQADRAGLTKEQRDRDAVAAQVAAFEKHCRAAGGTGYADLEAYVHAPALFCLRDGTIEEKDIVMYIQTGFSMAEVAGE